MRELDPAAVIADQDEIPGTGRAVACGLGALPDLDGGTVVVTYGDVPLRPVPGISSWSTGTAPPATPSRC